MSHKVFVISDLHFGHNKCYTEFKGKDGLPIRNWASDAEHGDEIMIERWNKTVRQQDKVYVLGDVAINRRHLKKAGLLNGSKILIKGNHDVFRLKEYSEFFKDIRAFSTLKGGQHILTHIPIHPDEFRARWKYNVHGHSHQRDVTKSVFGFQIRDDRYINVCVEKTGAVPVDVDRILSGVFNTLF